MATLWADANGTILRFVHNEAELRRYGAPTGATFTVSFDEVTNADIIKNLDTDWNSHSMSGGVLRRHGLPVAVNPDGPAMQDWKQVANVSAKLKGADTLSEPEIKMLFRVLLRATGTLVE